MSLVKWEPMQELARMREEMDRFFGRGLVETLPDIESVRIPSVDVREENGNLVVKADLPGIKKENVEVLAEEDALTIRGRISEEKEEEKEGYYRRERRSGSFLRKLTLPAAVAADKAKATFEDGTLTITLPKTATPKNGKTVPIS